MGANDDLYGPSNSGGNGVETELGQAACDVTWFKVDDGFYRHRKVRMLGRERVRAQARVAGAGLWVLSGGHAADNLTDGFVPWEVVEEWDPSRGVAGRLISTGLWVVTTREGERGIQFHDWEQSQPLRDQVLQRRKADAERKARWRESQKESRRDTQRDSRRESQRQSRRESHKESREESALPDPTRPVSTEPPLRSGSGAAAPRGAEIEHQATPERITAQTVAAAWVDAVRANDVDPSKAQIGQVAKTAKELLQRNQGERVLAAAQAAGAKGYVQIDRELTAMNGRQIARRDQRIPTTTARVAAIEALKIPDEQ